ncbi:type VI secretion system Vgr family protein [Advenella mimigardefordensis]|uniref:Putative type VI secretion system Rhs element Vgr protein n=1 Tax=Advenella mimigardefordensis (strain DSM 17166 / LMG 22922 / DPN7) TaxID=1247726 RepID=W0PFT7_ADVMD|nr:type VI secretion system tip protein TssI/VgrG [Advenella mimigardefordensis]AHG65541.1 putative type VI secretion system Rhs element Vgr protein [Advenella mimigardefordensis DPN7]
MDMPSQIEFRPIVAHTPLEGVLAFRQMSGTEALSSLFEFEVELVAESYSLDLQQLLGKSLTIEIESPAGSRYLDGQITKCVMVGRENSSSRYYIYRATVRPWLWYLTQTSDNKIFQNKTAPDVIREVLSDYAFPFDIKLNGTYRNWEYCVQYQETDFAFISRLMEHEGIYYYFQHKNGSHTLVITDDIATHEPQPGYASVPYYGPDRLAHPQEEYVSGWEVAAQITPDGYATTDYDFTKPRASLEAASRSSGGAQAGNLEMFEWQGGYQDPNHGEQYSRMRLEELQSVREQIAGVTNARGIAPGCTFTLKNHPRQSENREYLVVSVNYRMSVAGYASGTGMEDFYEETFTALPSSLQYRAARRTPIPHTHGPQTAAVVGPPGEQLWTDQYGRIKVQFHWDRYGKKNENSSCWVRVSSPWAGGGFGGLQLPRINDEVVVDFIGGCPDRPLVLGRVYNANNMPPVELPANASQSGFRSQSVHGDPSMANWLLFEDKLGAEMAHMKAQLNMLLEINNDCDHNIGNNHKTTVGGCQHVTVQQETHITRQGITNEQLNSAVRREINANYDTIINGVLNSEHTGDLIDQRTGEVIKNQMGSITDTVEGNITRELTGNKTSTQTGDLTSTINGMIDEKLNGNHNRTVVGDTNTTYQGNTTTTTTGKRTGTVNGGSMDTVFGIRQTYTVGAAVTGAIVAASGFGINSTFTGVNVAAHGFTGTLAGYDWKTAALGTRTTGVDLELKGADTNIKGILNSIKAVDNEVGTVINDIAATRQEIDGLGQKVAGARLRVGGITLRGTGLDLTA